MIVERDIWIASRGGIRLCANLFRPPGAEPVPVILSATPCGKDRGRDRLITFLMRLSGVRVGRIRVSRFTGFEAPDPHYWVGNGYAVMLADVRGMYKSEGQAGVLTDQDAADYYDLEIVALDIEILPSSTWFEAGSRLQLDVLGRDAASYPAFRHGQGVNSGRHAIQAGGRFDSHLLISVLRGSIGSGVAAPTYELAREG